MQRKPNHTILMTNCSVSDIDELIFLVNLEKFVSKSLEATPIAEILVVVLFCFLVLVWFGFFWLLGFSFFVCLFIVFLYV